MGTHFSSWRIIYSVLLVFVFAKDSSARRITDDFQERSSKEKHIPIHNGYMGHDDMNEHLHMNPSLNVFFTINDLKIGKTIPIYFPNKDPSTSPHLLSREETNSIPFSLSQLPYLLELFSFSKDSQQAKGMEYTLRQCEIEPIEGETKTCATSLESMLDFARTTFGLDTQFKVLTTNYLINPVKQVQNYTILEEPKEILARRSIGCHIMPYPFVVYYCHSREGGNRLFEMLLGGENGESIQAAAMCHMDTSQWDKNHVAFHLLKIRPGSSPVCHFFQADNIIWVPLNT